MLHNQVEPLVSDEEDDYNDEEIGNNKPSQKRRALLQDFVKDKGAVLQQWKPAPAASKKLGRRKKNPAKKVAAVSRKKDGSKKKTRSKKKGSKKSESSSEEESAAEYETEVEWEVTSSAADAKAQPVRRSKRKRKLSEISRLAADDSDEECKDNSDDEYNPPRWGSDEE